MMRSILRVLVLSAILALAAGPAQAAAPNTGSSLSGPHKDSRPQSTSKPGEEYQGLGVDRQLGVFAGTVLDISDRPIENVMSQTNGLISRCVPRAELLPGHQFRVYVFDSSNRNKDLAELNCLP